MDDMIIKDEIKPLNADLAASDLSKSFPGAFLSQRKRFINECAPKPDPPRKKLSLLSDTADDELKPLNWLISANLLTNVCGRPQVTKPPPPKRIFHRPASAPITKSWRVVSRCQVTREPLIKPSRRLLQNLHHHPNLHHPNLHHHPKLYHTKIEHENFPNHNINKLEQKYRFKKPPYSFATLIFMALEAAQIKRLRVKDIYQWIIEKFPYYRLCDRGWKNSVRHNLSLNRCFKRIDKDRRFECGKGSWWMLDPELRPELVQAFKKLGNVNMIPGPIGTENITPPQSPPFHTPPSSPDNDVFSAAGIDEQTAAAALCLMKRTATRSRHNSPSTTSTTLTPAQSDATTSSESSPEQLPPLVRDEQPPKRSIIIDKKSAEGVWALLSMANGR